MNITSRYPWPVLGDGDAVAGTFAPITEIDLGKDVKIEADADAILATIQEPKSQEELEAELATPTTGVEDVEVINKEKPEEGAAVEEAPEAKNEVKKE